MIGWWRQEDFRRRLAMAHEALPESAGMRGEGSCCKSGRCCWSGPCRLAPGDEQRLAEHLGVTVPVLFAEYLVVDESHAGTALVVYPRRAQWAGGRYLTSAETFDVDTPCVFLTEQNECRVHDAKPAGGVHYRCWDESTSGEPPGCEWTREQVLALGWDGLQWDDE